MNDRFNFRCWDKENKKFLHDLSFDISSNGTLILNCGIEGKKFINLNDNNRYILIQSTGLKDKNGKLIYEGDILKDKYGALHPISWNVKGFYEADTFAVAGFYNAIQEDMEVIGNKFENPELLKDCE